MVAMSPLPFPATPTHANTATFYDIYGTPCSAPYSSPRPMFAASGHIESLPGGSAHSGGGSGMESLMLPPSGHAQQAGYAGGPDPAQFHYHQSPSHAPVMSNLAAAAAHHFPHGGAAHMVHGVAGGPYGYADFSHPSPLRGGSPVFRGDGSSHSSPAPHLPDPNAGLQMTPGSYQGGMYGSVGYGYSFDGYAYGGGSAAAYDVGYGCVSVGSSGYGVASGPRRPADDVAHHHHHHHANPAHNTGGNGKTYPSFDPGPAIQSTPGPAGATGPPGCNLFVFHIPSDFTNVDLYGLFSPYGPLVSVRIMTERGTGRGRGFGFVSYADERTAQAAIAALDGLALGNKRLKVQFKQDRGGGREARRPGAPEAEGGGGGGGGRDVRGDDDGDDDDDDDIVRDLEDDVEGLSISEPTPHSPGSAGSVESLIFVGSSDDDDDDNDDEDDDDDGSSPLESEKDDGVVSPPQDTAGCG